MNDVRLESGQKESFKREALSLSLGDGAIGPFGLDQNDAYARWRDAKLERFPQSGDELVVELKNTAHPTEVECQAIRDRVSRAGMAIYVGPALADVEQSKDQVCALGRCFGLERLDHNPYADEDAITPLHVAAGTRALEQGRKMYIPYTNRPINWHTDGYYNTAARRIRAMILHCVRQAGGPQADGGGENALFDIEMAYLLMRERDPESLAAFCAPAAMTIPGNDMDDDVCRGDVTGPVFSLNRSDATLHMRYTARKRSIQWAEDEATGRGVAIMQDIMRDDGPGGLSAPYIFRHRLQPGQGLICNNVLHTRTKFADGAGDDLQRMMLRARYYDRIT
ncbi:MAG: TauD/TfdA family dioxygenase [Magnetovibrio sp.]|nr:TauD/TfdA family dioxygenase [Magnetovibrio sp.]